jgi:tetratricopeptide (TPR) repeat protein
MGNSSSRLKALLDSHCTHGARVLFVPSLLFLLVACAPDAVRRNNAGNRYYEERAYPDAVGAYRQAQVTVPDRPEPYYNAANAFNRQGQLDAAAAQTDQALKTADSRLAAWAWYNLGNAYFDVQDWPKAVAAYQESLRHFPDDPDAKHNLELALKNLEAEGANGQQPGQPTGDGQTQPEEPQPTPAHETGEAGAQGQPPSPQEPEMTPEQARQLLRALIGNAENIQQRLQEPLRVPLPPPEQDW